MRLLRRKPDYTADEAEVHNARLLGLNLPLLPKTKKRRKQIRREEPIHIAIVNYLESVLPPHFIVHHSRNGGLSKAENGRAKAMGTKAGWLDIVILGEAIVYSSLTEDITGPAIWFLEVKDEKGVLEESQKKFIPKIERLGIPYRVVRSIDDARQAIIDWRLPNRDLAIPK